MTKTIWYWEYQIRFWDDIDNQEEVRSGVVVAGSFTEAMERIEEYYDGSQIIEIQTLKPIIDGIFDFGYVTEDTEFGYTINKKEEE